MKDLKSFVALILKRKGTWKGKWGKKQNFQDNKITLHWTPSSKTLDITGPKETVENTEKLLNTLIQNVEVDTNGKEENTEDPDCTITKDEIKSIWRELNRIKNILQDVDGKPKVELNKKEQEQKNDETESTDETTKYKDTQITDFFLKTKKSEASLVECLRIRINKLEQERNMIAKQLNELKEKQTKTTYNKISNSTKNLSLKSRKKSPSKTKMSDTEKNRKSKPPPADKSKPPKTPVTPGDSLIQDPRSQDPRNLDPRNLDPENLDPRNLDPRNLDPGNLDPRYLDPGNLRSEKFRSQKFRSEKFRSRKFRSQKFRFEKFRSRKFRSEKFRSQKFRSRVKALRSVQRFPF